MSIRATLLTFQEGINQLLVYLNRSKLEHEFIASINEDSRKKALTEQELRLLEGIVDSATNTKQYIYIVSIVSIYGLLERLVDGSVSAFVIGLKRFSSSYADLPDAIKKNHLNFSILLADALIKDKFRTGISTETVIANLHSCFSGSEFTLNGTAFSLHRGNITIDRASEMITNIGIDNHLRRVLGSYSFSSFMAAREDAPANAVLSDADVRKTFDPIDDLVERRNSVSHGVVQGDDIESVDLLLNRCKFIRAYGEALCEILELETLKHAAQIGGANKLGKPIAVFDNRIVCFENKCSISLGDQLFAVTQDNLKPVRAGIIQSLQVNNAPVEKLDSTQLTRFAAAVNFHANDNYEYYWLPKEEAS